MSFRRIVFSVLRVGMVSACFSLVISPQSADAQSTSRFGTVTPDDSSFLSPENTSDPSRRPGQKNPQLVLREGTRIRPTPGRFVVSSGRWRFIPEPVRSGTGDATLKISEDLARITTSDRSTALGRERNSHDADPDVRPIFGTVASTATVSGANLPMMVVVENLMLSRVARAIQEDPGDDRWTITGEVTEFGDENRLILRTIRRSARSD